MKQGWQQKELGEIAQVGAGNSAPQKSEFFTNGTYPFFRTSDIGKIRFGTALQPKDYLNNKGIKKLRKFPQGTILFPKSGASTFLNHRVILGIDAYVSSHLATIIGDETKVVRKFLLYFLTTISAQDLIQDHSYLSLNLSVITQIPILLPSIIEQKRIVALLDDAFEAIDISIENAKKNLQNTRELFQNYLNEVFLKGGNGWVERKLGDISLVNMGQSPKGNTYNSEGKGIPLINGPVEFSQHPFGKTLLKKFTTSPTKICEKNDLILCVRGSTTGKMNIAGFTACIGRGVASIRATKVLQQWINYFIFTSREKIYELGTGSTFPNVSGAMLNKLPILVPP